MSIAAQSGLVQSESETRAIRSTWFIIGSIVHLLAWGVLLAVLWFDVPWHMRLFQDFGVSLPTAVIALIGASDLAVSYWYVTAPIVALIAIGMVFLVVGLCRSPLLRMSLLISLLFVPLGWAIWCHMLLTSVTSKLIHDLS